MTDLVVRIGTRSSELALRQARQVAAALAERGVASELVEYTTIGDRILDRPLNAIGEKGLFTAELEADLRANLETADFPQLEIEFLGAAEEHGRFVASARFHGMVSETLHATPVPFAEIWHFVKTPGDVRWLVAGIQQQG